MSVLRRPHVGVITHGGAGSWTRLHAVLRYLRARVTVCSNQPPAPALTGVTELRLPLPDPGLAPLVTAEVGWALGAAGAARLTDWIDRQRPDLLLVDGVPDAALLGRLAGVPVVPVRRFLPQDTDGHAGLRHGAAAWLAPYPAMLEPPETPTQITLRTVHTGFLSRFEGRRVSRAASRRQLGIPRQARHATILLGERGLGVTRATVLATAAACRSWTFSVVGRCERGGDGQPPMPASDDVEVVGWTDDPFPYLCAADVVVCDASLGSVADVAVTGVPFGVVISREEGADSRRLGDALDEAGLATALDHWPEPAAWPALLGELLDRDTRVLRRLVDGRAARIAADWIDAWAVTPPLDPASVAATQLAGVAPVTSAAPEQQDVIELQAPALLPTLRPPEPTPARAQAVVEL